MVATKVARLCRLRGWAGQVSMEVLPLIVVGIETLDTYVCETCGKFEKMGP
jgi:hypothetical protein